MPFRRLVAGVLVLAAVALTIVIARGGREPRPPTPTPAVPPRTPTPTATPTPVPIDTPTAGPSLAVGITEANPALIAAPDSRAVPPEWTRWRDALAEIRPVVYRVVLQWSSVQPQPGVAPDLAQLNGGCMRDKGPCAPFAGLRDQFRAAASRGWPVLLVFSGMPAWAAAGTPGCGCTDDHCRTTR